MSTTLKIAGLSAVLAAGLVAASLPTDASVPTGKAFTERLPQAPAAAEAPRLREVPADPCAKAVWPNVPGDCLAARRPVRTIAIEQRAEAGTSTLVRVAAPRTAR